MPTIYKYLAVWVLIFAVPSIQAQPKIADEAAIPIVSVNNELGYRLAIPVGAGPFPVVVFANNCQGYDAAPEILRGYHRHTARLINSAYAVVWNDYFKAKGIANCQRGLDWADWTRDLLRTAEWAKTQTWGKDQPVYLIGFSAGASAVPLLLADADRATKAFSKIVMMYPNCDIANFGPWKATVPVLHLVGTRDGRANTMSYCNDVVLRTQDKSHLRAQEFSGAYHGFDLYEEGSRAISGDSNGSASALASIAAWKIWMDFLK